MKSKKFQAILMVYLVVMLSLSVVVEAGGGGPVEQTGDDLETAKQRELQAQLNLDAAKAKDLEKGLKGPSQATKDAQAAYDAAVDARGRAEQAHNDAIAAEEKAKVAEKRVEDLKQKLAKAVELDEKSALQQGVRSALTDITDAKAASLDALGRGRQAAKDANAAARDSDKAAAEAGVSTFDRLSNYFGGDKVKAGFAVAAKGVLTTLASIFGTPLAGIATDIALSQLSLEVLGVDILGPTVAITEAVCNCVVKEELSKAFDAAKASIPGVTGQAVLDLTNQRSFANFGLIEMYPDYVEIPLVE